MAVEPIHVPIHRDTTIQPKLDNPEIIEKLRHGNIYEVLRSTLNAEDINKFINYQGRRFENSILQNYQVYANPGDVPAPVLDQHFAPHNVEMSMNSDDRHFFRQDMAMLRTAKAMENEPQGPGQAVSSIAEGALEDWNNFFTDLQSKMIDAQMVQQMKAKGEELNKETQRIISLVMSGQIEPEYVLIAAAKSNSAQNGILFSWKGKKIMHLNQMMDAASKELYMMDPNDQGYMKELQMAQSQTRGQSTQMSLEMMDLQKFAQNVGTTIEFANNAVRTFGQMRQTTTQNLLAR